MAEVVERKKGRVRWFDSQKGFGFIMPGDGGKDVFVHRSSVKAVGFISLTKGENVEYSIEVREDGRHSAVDVNSLGVAYLQGRRGPCFSCGEYGHFARDCILNNGSYREVGPCYSCGEMGHLCRQCPARLKCFEFPSATPRPWKRWSLDLQPSHSICGTSLPNFSPEEDFRMEYTPAESLQWRESTDLAVEEEQDFEEDYGEDDEEDYEEEYSKEDSEAEYSKEDSEEQRNWAELPRDVLSLIFKKIAAIDILMSAQFVCRAWRQLSHEPEIWRCIDMTDTDPYDTNDMISIAKVAVDRSRGCLEEFYAGFIGNDELIFYIADRTTRLRCLSLISVHGISEEGLAEALGRFDMLKELEISLCSINNVELIGQACPHLKSFSFNAQPCWLDAFESDSDWNHNEVAFDIAKHMQQLTRLQLIGDTLTNDGLHAILDNCPHLEFLDIRQCLYLNLDENLRKKCARIKVVKLPNDSLSDYHMDATIGGLEAPYEEYDHILYDSDFGFVGFENDGYSDLSYDGFFDDFGF